ncbi:MAG: DUF4249 domain-containing protein [Bacteroidota bacterium]
MNRLFVLCCWILLFIACSDFFSTTLEVEPPTHQTQLVLHAVLTDTDTIWNALIGRSIGLLETTDADGFYLNDAQVMLYQNEQEVLTLNPQTPDPANLVEYNFSAPVLPEQMDHRASYTFRVSHPDFPSLVARQSFPQQVPLSQSLIRENSGLNDFGERTNQVELRFTDPAGVANYYEVSLFAFDTTTGAIFLTELSTLDPNLRPGRGEGYLLSDERFDGNAYRLLMDYVPEWGEDVDVELYAIWRTVTSDYFRYALSVKAQEDAQDFGTFAEPVSIYSNVENGLGIFAMRTERIVKIGE